MYIIYHRGYFPVHLFLSPPLKHQIISSGDVCFMPTQKQLNTTKLACFTGYITQALVINFAPLLFITFTKEFRLSLAEISGLISLTFIVQLITDGVSVRIIDSVGSPSARSKLSHFCLRGAFGAGFFSICFPHSIYRTRCGSSALLCGRRAYRGSDQSYYRSMSF